MDYLRDPKAIYEKSFATIKGEAKLSHLPMDARDIAIRVVHACGMPEVAEDLRISPGFFAKASTALERLVLVDAEMVRHGIIDRKLEIICTLNDPRAKALGISGKTTRSAASVDLWEPYLADSLVVIGNAPTALFRLLELIDGGMARPAAIVAFPVGFVGAAESKEELLKNSRGMEYATLRGRRGGSAMAAAVVNALTRGLS